MKLNRQSVSITGSTLGSVGYTGRPINGVIHAIQYDASTALALSSTASLTIKGETSGVIVLDSLAVGAADFIKYVREDTVVNSTNGVAATFVQIPIIDERVSIAVGVTTATGLTGTFYVISEGS
jgi:hypothetical protein